MKTETYDYTSIDEAIERLQKLKAEGKNPKNVVILTMDFDNNIYSDEWKWIVDNLFHVKCDEVGYCTEAKSCGRKPEREM